MAEQSDRSEALLPGLSMHRFGEGEDCRLLNCVEVAKSLFRLRQARMRAFGDDGAIFGEPAWDILLSLYIADSGERRVSRVRASTVAGIPQSTGLRILTGLEANGLVVRTYDPDDRRRSYITLSERAKHQMEGSLYAFFDKTKPATLRTRARRQRMRDETVE